MFRLVNIATKCWWGWKMLNFGMKHKITFSSHVEVHLHIYVIVNSTFLGQSQFAYHSVPESTARHRVTESWGSEMGQKVNVYVTRGKTARAIGKTKILLASSWKFSPGSLPLNQDCLVHTMNSETISSCFRPISLSMHRIATELLWKPYLPLLAGCGLYQSTWSHTAPFPSSVDSSGVWRFYNVNNIIPYSSPNSGCPQ